MIKKILIPCLVTALSISTLSANDDFDFDSSEVEVVESNQVKSNYNKNQLGIEEIEKASNETQDIDPENMTAEEIVDSKLSAEDKMAESLALEMGNDSKSKTTREIYKKKFVVKDYRNIRYKKGFDWFSIMKHDKGEFNSFLSYLNLPLPALKSMYGKADTLDQIRLNAYAYDFAYNKPNIAENYYKLFTSQRKIGFLDQKIRYADFLIRTGRPSEVKKIITKKDCVVNFKFQAKCNYYLGVAEYLTTGNHKNLYLRLSKSYVSKANKIYNKNKRKK